MKCKKEFPNKLKECKYILHLRNYCSSSLRRFRWAVCQLDILRRLRPDVSNIKAALSNLPKTLDETYDRIFLDIPEDDWLSVQHVFHWLVYHNDLFGDNISLSTLLQAVQQSTLDSLIHSADQLHNFEGLRERCGCLILVERQKQSKITKDGIVDYQSSTVSFAHYTVKEYLQSPRVLKKKLAFFALDQERIQKEFAEIAFRQALAIPPGVVPAYDRLDDLGLFKSLLDADFRLYCGISSVLQLNIWSEVISSNSTMMELGEALVNPDSPGYDDLESFLAMANNVIDITKRSDLYSEFQFWGIIWEETPNPKLVVFLNFLMMSAFSGTPHLALAFAAKHSMLPILTQHFEIEKEVWHVTDRESTESYKHEGSIPEMVAQWAFRQPETFDLILDTISQHGVAHYNISKLLLLYIGSHLHCDCKNSCPLEILLNLGANACGPEEAFVSPLQIAVANWDLHSTQVLLNAGAEPNAIGNGSSEWAPESLMERFNSLHGASPLHIIKHFSCIYAEDMMSELDLDEIIRKRIEGCLLQFGGVEIEPDNSGLESASLTDNSVG